MKKIMFILGCLVFVNLGAVTEVKAEEKNSSSANHEVLYDMNQGGVQQFEVIDGSGEDYIITIEEDQSILRAASTVSNGTYTITKERALQWKASYKIDVKANAITRAHSPSVINYVGSVTSSNLKIDHSKQATYYIKMKVLTLVSSVNVRAKLQNNTIVVTY